MLMAENLLLMRRRYRTSVSAAALFLATYGPLGMVLDFADASVAIVSSGGALDFQSQGQISNGALVGPGAKLTYTAPSLKLTEQADGNLGFQAHNLCLQSEALTSGTWAKTGSTAPSADTITVSAGSSNHLIYQNITALPGATYTAEVELKAGTYRYVSLQLSDNVAHGVGRVLDLQTGAITASITLGTLYTIVGTPTVTDKGDGYYKVSITYTHGATGTTTVFAVFARPDASNTAWGPVWSSAGTETFQIRKAHLRRAPSASDYIATTSAAAYDLPYVYSSGVRTGNMVEPAATNICTRSSSLVSPWSLVSITPTANAVAGLSGAMNADEVTINAGSSTHYAQFNLTWTAAVHTTYAIVRYRNHPFVQITSWDGTTSRYCNFDISGGTVGSASGMTGTIIPLGGSKYLIAATSTTNMAAAGGNVTLAAIPNATSTANPSWTAAGTEKYDFLHFQIEAGASATSPIITYGSPILRAADNISIATSLFPYSATASTLFGQGVVYGTSSAAANTLVALNDGTGSERILIRAFDGGAASQFVVTDGGATQLNIQPAGFSALTDYKFALAATANSGNAARNGTLGTEDTTITMPTVTTLAIGRETAGASLMNGLISRVAYFPERKADAVLQTMTGA